MQHAVSWLPDRYRQVTAEQRGNDLTRSKFICTKVLLIFEGTVTKLHSQYGVTSMQVTPSALPFEGFTKLFAGYRKWLGVFQDRRPELYRSLVRKRPNAL